MYARNVPPPPPRRRLARIIMYYVYSTIAQHDYLPVCTHNVRVALRTTVAKGLAQRDTDNRPDYRFYNRILR